MDSQNPLPYTFGSPEELQMSLDLAKHETLNSLYQQFNRNYRNMSTWIIIT